MGMGISSAIGILMNQLVEVEAFFELTDDAVDVARFFFGGF